MAATKTKASSNGQPQQTDEAAAVAFEAALAVEAAEIRGDEVGLTPELFLKLWPLLRRPIPQGFIQKLAAVTGKPYESTGIKSVQVQMDRMDNVLTPLGWNYSSTYEEAGKVCHVTVRVVANDGQVLVERDSQGGVNQASTLGNLRKGSFTNAAKVAFAHVGPGHEVYVGITDLDPDVHAESAAAQAAAPATSAPAAGPPLAPDDQQKIVTAFTKAGITEDFPLYLKAVGAQSVEEVTAAQAYRLREHLDAYIAKQAAS